MREQQKITYKRLKDGYHLMREQQKITYKRLKDGYHLMREQQKITYKRLKDGYHLMREQQKDFSTLIKTFSLWSLYSTSAKKELYKHMNDFDISVTCIQEHRQVHLQEYIRIDRSTMFLASATRKGQVAAVEGV